ncbi:hypothetical protein BGV40_05950 [Methanosarcina sp. Ant1]|nr:hypothetical protein BGV40_05950 [Methanosarcina sp. Ant1]
MSLDIFTSYNDDKATINTRDKNRRVLEEPDSSRTVIKKNENIRRKSSTKSEKEKKERNKYLKLFLKSLL